MRKNIQVKRKSRKLLGTMTLVFALKVVLSFDYETPKYIQHTKV